MSRGVHQPATVRRCDFTGCTQEARYALCVRAWSNPQRAKGDELVFKFGKACCFTHVKNPGPIDGLLSEDIKAQVNWSLLSSGKKPRDFTTAEFCFERLTLVPFKPRGT